VAVDSQGRLFVADQFNSLIRLITPAGTIWNVTTIAGQTTAGFSDGLGASAQFDAPSGVAVDTNGNVYVADLFNNAIRKLVPSGANWLVSTISGGPGGNGTFNLPFGVTADAFGDVFVANSGSNAICIGIPPGSAPATGALEVAITPASAVSAGAQWQLDGGLVYTNGAIVSGLAPGNHTINFTTATDFTLPAAQIVPVTARQTMLATGEYTAAIANAGSLQVSISPPNSVEAGAQWSVDGGAWQTNEAIVGGVSVGAHTVSFYPVTGWTTPASQMVSVTLDQTTLATVNYVFETGSLLVVILPTNVVTAGAKWQVDGGPFQTSGMSLSGLSPGSHVVDFNTVIGWNTPASQVVSITNALTTEGRGTYTVYGTASPPQVASMTVAGGEFHFTLQGQVGNNYIVQASPDLVRWTPISTNTMPADGSMLISDPASVNVSHRFYRAFAQ
jgi:hypothetical protein